MFYTRTVFYSILMLSEKRVFDLRKKTTREEGKGVRMMMMDQHGIKRKARDTNMHGHERRTRQQGARRGGLLCPLIPHDQCMHSTMQTMSVDLRTKRKLIVV